MPKLKGSETQQNLKTAFAAESQDNRRCIFFARQASAEGYVDVAEVFRDVAEADANHALGHLEYLKKVADPATDLPIADTEGSLRAAIAAKGRACTEIYPSMARVARDEGFDEIGEWFEHLAALQRRQLKLLQKGLASME